MSDNSSKSQYLAFTEKIAPVGLYALAEHKNALDDCAKKALEAELGFSVKHHYTDARLLLGYVASAFGIGGALYGYRFAFEAAKPVVMMCVIGYIVVTALTTLLAVCFEKNVTIRAVRSQPDGKSAPLHLALSTSATPDTKFKYSLSCVVTQGGKVSKHKRDIALGECFDATGRVVPHVVLSAVADAVNETVARLKKE
ncbi:hypothetical protein RI367_006989 [Sorochytrium milnesiophthora]